MVKCIRCNESCYNVGDFNKDGIMKSYCCNCYLVTPHKEKTNPDFNGDKFCFVCKKRTIQIYQNSLRIKSAERDETIKKTLNKSVIWQTIASIGMFLYILLFIAIMSNFSFGDF